MIVFNMVAVVLDLDKLGMPVTGPSFRPRSKENTMGSLLLCSHASLNFCDAFYSF